MSLFITNLAFKEADFVTSAKMAILFSSLIVGMVGWMILRLTRFANEQDSFKNA